MTKRESSAMNPLFFCLLDISAVIAGQRIFPVGR